MINNKRVLIIIPAWNKSASIADVVPEVHGELPGVGVLVVDDGSTEDDERVAAAGAGAAVRPCRTTSGSVAPCVPATATPGSRLRRRDPGRRGRPARSRYIPKLVDALDGADLVIGRRFAGEGDTGAAAPRNGRWDAVPGALQGREDPADRHDLRVQGRGPVPHRTVRPLVPGRVPWRHNRGIGPRGPLGFRIVQVPVAMRSRMAGTPSASPIKATLYLFRAFFILLLALVRA